MKTLRTSDRKIATDLKKALKRASIPVHSLIVFGSRARHTARVNSDFDVLVVLERIPRGMRERILNVAWRVGYDADVLIHPVIKKRRRIEGGVEQASLLMLEVRAHGLKV